MKFIFIVPKLIEVSFIVKFILTCTLKYVGDIFKIIFQMSIKNCPKFNLNLVETSSMIINYVVMSLSIMN